MGSPNKINIRKSVTREMNLPNVNDSMLERDET